MTSARSSGRTRGWWDSATWLRSIRGPECLVPSAPRHVVQCIAGPGFQRIPLKIGLGYQTSKNTQITSSTFQLPFMTDLFNWFSLVVYPLIINQTKKISMSMSFIHVTLSLQCLVKIERPCATLVVYTRLKSYLGQGGPRKSHKQNHTLRYT